MFRIPLENILENLDSLYCFENAMSINKVIVNKYTEYYSPDLYNYEYNNYGYRSIDFSEDIDILTVGCSFTFGSGLPFEYTWSQQLQKKIPNKKVANLSWPGLSAQRLISYLFRYFKHVGNPKMIICNFPNFHRFLFLEKESEKVIGYYRGIHNYKTMKKKEKTEILSSAPPEKWGHFVNYEYIYMLEQYCESNNIKLVWSFWDLDLSDHHDDHEIFQRIGFESSSQFLKSKFKNFYTDQDNIHFDNMIRNLSFDKKGNLAYSELCPQALAHCHKELQTDTQDFFEAAYDRYTVPTEDQLQIEKHLKMSRLEKDKNLTSSYGYLAHFGSHRNIHWAEFYYRIIKEQYPDFV
jgi:hypothetical protein